MASFYSTGQMRSNRAMQWYSDAEISGFPPLMRSGAITDATGLHPYASQPFLGGHKEETPRAADTASATNFSGAVAAPLPACETAGVGTQQVEASGQPSFYGRGPKLNLRPPRQVRTAVREHVEDYGSHLAVEPVEDNAAGQNLHSGSFLPKRPQRAPACYALDKEIGSSESPNAALTLATRDGAAMDGANWANLVYAMAHFKKHEEEGGNGRKVDGNVDGSVLGLLRNDPRWARGCRALRPLLPDLTARDAANVLWSLATLDARNDALYLETADALCRGGKLSVIDPVSVSKAAWALTTVSSRDRRLEFFGHLAVPIVLRAEAFPLGALTMTCYAFAKAAHRDADVYEALSSALARHPDKDLRPIDICNVVWAFCTVGYRDDELFQRICNEHLVRPEVVEHFNPQDLSNTTWGFSKVTFIHVPAMDELARQGVRLQHSFKAIHFSNFFYSFAMLRLRGPEGFLSTFADAAVSKLATFDSGNLAIMVWALAQLSERHVVLDAALALVQRPEIAATLTSRATSMLFLAFFKFGRPAAVDAIFDAKRASGATIGASGYSALVMSAEHGEDAEREVRLQLAMADEAGDDRMWAAVANSVAIRLCKRSRTEHAGHLLAEWRRANPRRWSSVSSCLLARLATGTAQVDDLPIESGEMWQAPVKSGIHPIAATRQNEGPHAYTREFMTLQAVLCGAPQGDVDACMAAVEQFAESRSLWLKITAWEKAVVVHEVARLARPKLVLEIGAYVGYSAMNIARAVRPYGGRVVSLEVDPMHVTIVRNMVEYAGLTDSVDVWTGYCYDVIPQLLNIYGPRSIGMVFMDQKGTRFHTDLQLMEELNLLVDGAVVLADNVLKPGAPLYIWHLVHGPYKHATAVSVREFLLQSEDWMVMAFHEAEGPPVAAPPLHLHRIAFESDAFRKRSMFDCVAPSKSDWWAFSQRFVEGLERAGCKPPVVGLHGRDNPVIQPEDIASIFRRAGRLT